MKKIVDHRQRILAVAREKFLRYGFTRVSIDSIVRELRTSKSTVYKYFRTKEDLIRGVIDQLNDEINNQLASVILAKDVSFCNKLSAVIEQTHINLTKVNEEFFLDLKFYTPDIWAYYEQSRQNRITRYYKQLLLDGLEEGIIRNDIDVDVLLEIYLHLTEMTVNAEQFTRLDYSNQQLYKDISKVFLEGVMVMNENQ